MTYDQNVEAYSRKYFGSTAPYIFAACIYPFVTG